MKKIQAEICMCTSCIINGSPQIMEAAEKLRDLRGRMQEDCPFGKDEIIIVPCKNLGTKYHSEISPLARINGKFLPKTNGEEVMKEILSCLGERNS